MIKPAFYITILLFTCFSTVKAQENLIINGDFEDYSSCPLSESSPSQNPKEIERCIGWKAPTFGTSDYFNTCTTNPVISIPTNNLGVQNPFNGTGYLGGFFTSYSGGAGDDGYSGIMWWEYIQGQLTTSLIQGHIYKFSMEVSLAEYSDLMITEIGVNFSINSISSPNTAALTVSPQCIFYDQNHFRDTLNWIHLETYFMSGGDEKHITIGNFRNNVTTDTLRRYDISPQGNVNPFCTYFYLDNVVLTDITFELPIANVFTPNGDGLNDSWKLPFSEKLGAKKVTILNRWGNNIFEGDLNGFSWDGTTGEGKKCSDGTYFYRVSDSNLAGFIELMR